MPGAPALALLAAAGLVAGGVGGLVGFGSAVLLLPVCNAVFGPLPTVGILTVASLLGNLSRAALWWRDVRWEVVWRYWAGGVPAALAGSLLIVRAEPRALSTGLGLFILSLVPARRWLARNERRMELRHFPAVGAAMGLLSSAASTAGPVNAPFFLAHGLAGGAYLGTEALGTAGVHLAKSAAYGRWAGFGPEVWAAGLGLGVCLLLGAALAKPLVSRLAPGRFVLVVEALLVASGALMVAQAALGGG